MLFCSFTCFVSFSISLTLSSLPKEASGTRFSEPVDNACSAFSSHPEKCMAQPDCRYCNLGAYAGRYCTLKTTTCGSFSPSEYSTLFRQWKNQCGVSYHDSVEEMRRFENFRTHLDRIAHYNEALGDDQQEAQLFMNRLGDRSDSELFSGSLQDASYETLFARDAYSCEPVSSPVQIFGSIPDRIADAMRAYIGHSTADGPGGGTLACAWAVNNIMSNAGLRKIGDNPDNVSSVAAALRGSRGTPVSRANAVAGDIAVACGEGHIGICSSNQCDTIESNSSSRRCFCWGDSFSGFSTYFGCPPSLYRVTN